jgi:transmembrane sensor
MALETADPDDPIAEEVIGWMVLIRSGEASSADERELARWRSSDPRCEAAWQRLNGSLAAFRVTANQALPKGTLARSVLQKSMDRRAAIKSCLAFGLIGAGGLSIADQFFPLGDLLADLRTDTAQRRTYKLADGSSAVLGARSAADTDFRIEHRILSLRDGVVMVDILPDPSRPFIVRTPTLSIASNDGSLVVRRNGAVTTASVIRSVAQVVTNTRRALSLPAGQSARFDGTTLAQEKADVDGETSWTDGILVVNDRSLSYMIDALRPYYPGIIRLDPDIAALRVTGVFSLANPRQALDALAQTLPVRVRRLTPYFISVTTPA